jgi:hypothetical protein
MMMAVAGLVCSLGTVRAAPWTAIPTGRSDYQIWRGDEQLFSIETQVIGPGWARAEITKLAQAEGNRRVYAENVGFKTGRGGKATAAAGDVTFDFRYEAAQPKPNALAITTRTRSKTDEEAVGVGVIVSTTDFFAGGEGLVTLADGNTTTFTMPLGMGRQGNAVTSIALKSKQGATVKVTMSRPVHVTSDRGELRIWAWSDKIAAGKEEATTVSFEFPEMIQFEPVKATITLAGTRPFRVCALDHDGCKPATPVELPVGNRQFTLDGAKYQTMYYLVEF